MRILVAPTFLRAAKRLHRTEKADLDDAVQKIAASPLVGEAKVGDLAGVRVFKFRMGKRVCLLAYGLADDLADDLAVKLLAFGSNENFYRDLKR